MQSHNHTELAGLLRDATTKELSVNKENSVGTWITSVDMNPHLWKPFRIFSFAFLPNYLTMKRVKVNIGRHWKERWSLLLLCFRTDFNLFGKLLEPYFAEASPQLILQPNAVEIPADGNNIESSWSVIGSTVAVPILPCSLHPQLSVFRW